MIDLRVLEGAAARERLDDVAALRIAVFRDWPYLYDGDAAYERRYLAPYAESDTACLVAAFDGAQVVGATTGAAMEDHKTEFSAPLAAANMPLDQVFYCAESVLLPTYRGQGLGHRFFDAREAKARALGRRWSVFCAVIRPSDHPARPPDYRPLDPFWRKRGYAPLPGALARFHWRDIGAEAETEKTLQIWRKAL